MIKYSICKINLGLSVLARRADGFSDIETVMYPVRGICDIVEMIPSARFAFSNSGIAVDCAPQNNLCVRAYDLMRTLYDLPEVELHLHKNIPFGAGLGAGSANAVAVLKLCNELFSLGLDNDTLRSVAARLGSDTAFFVDETAAVARGRGDLLSPSSVSLSGYYLYMVKPEIGVSTAEAYRCVVPRVPKITPSQAVLLPIEEWPEQMCNDFERPIFAKHPILESIKNELYDAGAIFASMSGSGSTIYALYNAPLDRTFPHFMHCEML